MPLKINKYDIFLLFYDFNIKYSHFLYILSSQKIYFYALAKVRFVQILAGKLKNNELALPT